MSKIYIKEVISCNDCPGLITKDRDNHMFTRCGIHENEMIIMYDQPGTHKDCPLENSNKGDL